MRKKIMLTLLVSVFFVLIVSAFTGGFDARADIPTVKATGTLTSIEDDGTVIIDEKGYKVDPSVLVVNRKGRPVALGKLQLPTKVRFEYIYAKEGFIVVYIEEVKIKEAKKMRSR